MLIYYFIIVVFLFVLYNKTKKNFVVCLMYHSVYKKKVPGIISTKEFERHMKYIKNKKTFKMEELKELNYKLPKNSILVTFDDGYKNNYTEAFPILKKYGIKATIFINTKYVGNDDYYLSWENVKEMYESGLIDFQMHTHSHGLTIEKIDVRGFYEDETSPYFKRESFGLFFNEKYDNDKDKKKLTGLPIFKCRSQISTEGYRVVKNFVEKYKKIEKELKNKDDKEKKVYLNKIFKERQNEFFEKISREKYEKIVKFEIGENKKIIEEKLKKTSDVLAYPWGHRYKGNRKDIKKLGVNVFVTTRVGANSLKINKNWIYRVSGDDFDNFDEFKKELKNGTSAIYRKIFKK